MCLGLCPGDWEAACTRQSPPVPSARVKRDRARSPSGHSLALLSDGKASASGSSAPLLARFSMTHWLQKRNINKHLDRLTGVTTRVNPRIRDSEGEEVI